MFDLRHRASNLPTVHRSHSNGDEDDKLQRTLRPVLANKLVSFIVGAGVLSIVLFIISFTYTTESTLDRAARVSFD